MRLDAAAIRCHDADRRPLRFSGAIVRLGWAGVNGERKEEGPRYKAALSSQAAAATAMMMTPTIVKTPAKTRTCSFFLMIEPPFLRPPLAESERRMLRTGLLT